MRPGPARGDTRTLDVTVTPEMSARVGDREIHPIYGTTALTQHVEQLCREILEPHLEDGEEGVGYKLQVTHHAPAPVGADLTLVASVADVGTRRLLIEVAVRHGTRLIAHASFEQRVVDSAEFTASYAAG